MLWLRRLLFRDRLHAELEEEIQQHLSERTEALIDSGLTPEDAARKARRAIGNITLATEHSVEVWRWHWLDSLWADFRLAAYQLIKSPGYSLTAILTLAIGIGANAAIFTLVDDAMLRSLPVQRPAELVKIGYKSQATPRTQGFMSLRVMAYLQQHTSSVSDISGWSESMLFVPDDRGTLRSIPGNLVTGNALSTLGLKPYLGRLLTTADNVPGGPEGGWPVVLDYGFWLANYHGDPDVVGKHIRISGQSAIIVGVLPASFGGIFVGDAEKVYMPMYFFSKLASKPSEDPYTNLDNFWVLTIGRLRPGVSLAALNTELAAASPAVLHTLVPPAMLMRPDLRGASLASESASRGFSAIARDYSQTLLLLQGIVSLVLLLCCVNLAGLQLARVQARQHEFAIRAALGAGRFRILQQCLVESLLLATIGSIIAAALAWISTSAIAAFLTPAGSGEATLLRPDARVLLFTTALAVIAALLFGLVPAFLAGRTAPAALLKAKATNQRVNKLRQRLFLPAQFALALVLVFAAGLFTRTLVRLRGNNSGFNPTHVTEVCAQFQSLKKTPTEVAALYRAMTEDLRTRPGIQSASYTWVTPLTGYAPKVVAHTTAHPQEDHSITFNEVGDGYFSTIGTHVLQGREFTQEDRDRTNCVLNQATVRILFPNGAAIGDTLKATYSGDEDNPWVATCRVVGLVEDARYASLREPAPPTVYFPAGAEALARGGYSNNFVFFLRSQTGAEASTAYRATLALFAPDTGYSVFLPLSEQVDQSLGSERLIATLSSAFAGVALLLSAIGLFGVLALRVQQRTPEFGIRIAVGASREHLVGLVLREAMIMVGVGAVIGIVFAMFGSHFVQHFLYEAPPIDFSVVGAATIVLLVVALIAAMLPAIRAAWLEPTRALRNE
ncbi:ADOP family duplicated permease [Acidicapsa ligni]|uniref:ADOP family duplicated permease n=1 Tax=Acidicapsa ligni TaxID=542300 RepID=UPI0021E07BFD|nr:ADOP family duplicated permease [Acidicapsa ligni]